LLQGALSAFETHCSGVGHGGLQATRLIRQAEKARIPIIALTAGASSTERRLAFQAGMDGFLSKPVHREDLARVLEPLFTPTQPVDR
jgi:CheY-like chemotaxis protein